MAKTMLFSEAIRLGSTLKPKAKGAIFDGVGTCAYGAALDAVGLLVEGGGFVAIKSLAWGWMYEKSCDCPACNLGEMEIAYVVTHLNDSHDWSRERIADFVAELEIRFGIGEPVAEYVGEKAAQEVLV